MKFVFFGTPETAVLVLEKLREKELVPSLVVTTPDKPQGRGLTLASSPVKKWAEKEGIPVLQPQKLSDPDFAKQLADESWDLFVVVIYGKIIPKNVLEIPRRGILNVHPSLLPKHRGPSPVISQILHETSLADVGVSIMLLDEEMDHGPVLAQKNIVGETNKWPLGARALYTILGEKGGQLLGEIIPPWVAGTVSETPQEHDKATYCKKTEKEDGLIDLSGKAEENYRKILAYEIWPRTYFFAEKNGKKIRVVITEATLQEGALVIKKVIPEGKKEMTFAEFVRG